MLGDALAAALPELRAHAESRMASRCTIRRKTGGTVRDWDAGTEVPEWIVVHTDLPVRVDGGSSSDGGSRTVNIAGIDYELATGVDHFPATTTDLADNDFVEITVGESAGAVHRIIKAVRLDQKTARRVPVVEERRPEEWS